jgi:hypothetical protein
MKRTNTTRRSPASLFASTRLGVFGFVLGVASLVLAQIDPNPRSLLQPGYDQSLSGDRPKSLYADLAMEVSVWFERQWRFDGGPYGFSGDRRVQPATDLYWLYAGLSYAWTNTGNQFTFALTAGGSDDADRFSAWRLGGVLPLAAELPLTLPGYYYQEISARGFVHLSADHRWQLRLGVASAYVDYLPRFELPSHRQTGVGPGLSFTSRSGVWRIVMRYGYGIIALRDGEQGAHSVGVLFQYDFDQRKQRHAKDKHTTAGG